MDFGHTKVLIDQSGGQELGVCCHQGPGGTWEVLSAGRLERKGQWNLSFTADLIYLFYNSVSQKEINLPKALINMSWDDC